MDILYSGVCGFTQKVKTVKTSWNVEKACSAKMGLFETLELAREQFQCCDAFFSPDYSHSCSDKLML